MIEDAVNEQSRFDDLPQTIPAAVGDAFQAVFDGLTRPGQALTSAQRIAIANIARDAAPRPLWEKAPDLLAVPDSNPNSSDPNGSDPNDSEPVLTPFIAALAERVAIESRSLDRATVAAIIERIGDTTYAEIVAVITQVIPIDHLHRSLDLELEPLPAAGPGEPTGARPDDLGDIGAFIEMTDPYQGANVARSLTLAGGDNNLRLKIVRSMYSGNNFGDMIWTDRSLSRPQIELVASRTSALNECFY